MSYVFSLCIYTLLKNLKVYALDAMSGKLRWLSDRIAANRGRYAHGSQRRALYRFRKH